MQSLLDWARSMSNTAALPRRIRLSICLAVLGLSSLSSRPAGIVHAGPPEAGSRGAGAVREYYNTDPAASVVASAEQVLAGFELPEGFTSTVYAAEPDVQQPIGLTWDDRGRLWVAECYTYAESKVNFAADQRDRIVILEDTDHDGKADRRTVFWDGANKLTSVEVGFGGVWALCAPQLLFIPDQDGDDRPDGEPIVMLDGWNDDAVRHNIVNGLRWGPDGWLYGRHGIMATSFVGRPGTPTPQRVALNCCIWRFHPVTHKFDVICHGTTNPWGMDFDEYGQLFFTNTVIGHLWQAIPGAYLRRMYGTHANPYLYQLIDQIADHYHFDTGRAWNETRNLEGDTDRLGGGHAHCGAMIYLGNNWPEQYRGLLFTINMHGRRLNMERLERNGVGYVGRRAGDVFKNSEIWFRGIDLSYGPDGSVIVADWSDVGECHENDGVHRTSGRMYRLAYGTPKAPAKLGLRNWTTAELIESALAGEEWFARQARLVLHERVAAGRDTAAIQAAVRARCLAHDSKLSAVAVLRQRFLASVTGVLNESTLLGDLRSSPHEHVRARALRLWLDLELPRAPLVDEMVRLAETDPSGLVRLELASSLQRVSHADRWRIIHPLAVRQEDATDLTQALMLWYGIEPAVVESPAQSIQLAAMTPMSTLRRHLARRLASEIDSLPSVTGDLLSRVSDSTVETVHRDVLQGITAGLEGRRRAPEPVGWSQYVAAVRKAKFKEASAIADELSIMFGDGLAMDRLKKIAQTGGGDPVARRQAIRALAETRDASLRDVFLKLLNDQAVAGEAVRALAADSDESVPQQILSRYGRFDAPTREQAVTALTGRVASARLLMQAVRSGQVAARDLTAYQARQLVSLKDAEISGLVKELWGEVQTSSAEKEQVMARLKGVVAGHDTTAGDRQLGRVLWQKKCANCHTLFGEGGKVGPELTGSNRANLDYLLENIVDPSALVAREFRVSAITLNDGRTLTGVVLESTPQVMYVQTQNERVAVPRSEVDEVLQTNSSLMPEGLLQGLSDAEVRQLLAYASSPTQVAWPEGAVPQDSGDAGAAGAKSSTGASAPAAR